MCNKILNTFKYRFRNISWKEYTIEPKLKKKIGIFSTYHRRYKSWSENNFTLLVFA